MAHVRLNGLSKSYGKVDVIKDVSLDIEDGEFVVLIGPSGCGKSTLLRMIAGLESISAGTLEIGGAAMNDVPPRDRGISMVFQSYALYPHMSSADNMSFSLRLAGEEEAQRRSKVDRAADILGLGPYLDRLPRQLSGGQRQRVAMGRAIVRKPEVFLFDEPLSNLDAKLRVKMRAELKELHQKLRTTTIYVTHDQVEAMTLADRIVVLRDGEIEQIGTPQEIYSRPINPFVADFIGTMNFLAGIAGGQDKVRVGDIELATSNGLDDIQEDDAITVCIRPEDVATRGVTPDTENAVPTVIETLEFLGSFYRASLAVQDAGETTIRADFSINLVRDLDIKEGQEFTVALPSDHIRVYGEIFTHADDLI